MKGIILAGGSGTRLYPLTKAMNKHLLPVGTHPMVEHAVLKLKQAGLTDILLVTGRQHLGDMVRLLGSGLDYGVSLTYKVQEEPGGIAQALSLAEGFVNGDLMTVLLGDNLFEDDLAPEVERFIHHGHGATLFLKKVDDPTRFGVPEISGNQIVRIEEKPKYPKSSFAVTGIYMYDAQVFEMISHLRPSGRNELEITDVNNAYIERKELTYHLLSGWWTDAGTFQSLHAANHLALKTNF